MAEGAAALAWAEVPVALPEEGQSAAFELAGLRLLLCHAERHAYVVEDLCPHMRAPLSGGTLRGTLLECPLHGGKIDVRDGAAAALPIRRSACTYPVRRDGERIEVGLPASR